MKISEKYVTCIVCSMAVQNYTDILCTESCITFALRLIFSYISSIPLHLFQQWFTIDLWYHNKGCSYRNLRYWCIYRWTNKTCTNIDCGHDLDGFIYIIISEHIYVDLYHSVFDLINTFFPCVCKHFCVRFSVDYSWYSAGMTIKYDQITNFHCSLWSAYASEII